MRRIRKGQYGFPVITVSPKEYLDKGAEVILKAMEPIGKAISKTLSSPQWGGSSAQMNYARNATLARAQAKRASAREKAFEEKVGPALSPTNHVVAWTQGSWNPKVGQLKIAEWGPLALLGSLGVDAMGFKYVPKGVKTVTKNGKAYVISKSIDKAIKKGQPKVKQSVNTELFLKPLKSNKQLRVVSEGTYPMYRGKQHSVKEVVNPDGTINPRLAMKIQHEVSELFPGSYRMERRLENRRNHKTDPTTYHHTKNVASSAWGLDVPYGFTKHDLMVAALGHDFGKMVAGDGHAQIGADLVRLVFPDLTDAQYTAIAEHMGTPKTSLGKATKTADIDNGRSVGLNSSPLTNTWKNSIDANEINISPQELYKALQELKDYYFLGHGTGRTGVNPQTIFDNGLRVKNGDISNTTMPISESNLTNWPHMNSEEIIIMPGRAAMTKYDSAYGHIPSDWYNSDVFHWTDNPKKVGSGPFAVFEPNASFTKQTIGGVPGVYTKPEAVLGSYNTRTHTLRLNPRSQYKFTFKPLIVDKKKKGGKTHRPFGHRSILDNGWQSTKQLKNKKNVYGK